MSMSSIQLNFILAVSHLQSYNHTAFYLAVKELRNKYLAHQEPRNELDLCLTINPEIIFFKKLETTTRLGNSDHLFVEIGLIFWTLQLLSSPMENKDEILNTRFNNTNVHKQGLLITC